MSTVVAIMQPLWSILSLNHHGDRLFQPCRGSKPNLLAQDAEPRQAIIVVTIQTLPFAMAEIRKYKGLRGRKFAVIADETDSSQSGHVAAKLSAVLAAEELKGLYDGDEIAVEAILAAEATEQASAENITSGEELVYVLDGYLKSCLPRFPQGRRRSLEADELSSFSPTAPLFLC